MPVSGSAYTYAYASFGELIAWIIGWDLLIEYAIGNIAVAISWSDYFTGLLSSLRIGGMEGIHLPAWMTMDYLSAARGHAAVSEVLGPQATAAAVAANADLSRLSEAFTAWTSAPRLGPLRVIADLPALVIVALVTMLVYVGIRESKRASNAMVIFKLLIIFVVIGVGAFFVDPDNWSPFAPNGITGVLRGVSGVFFAYIGFDAITTTAEEARNPRRDLPRAMFYSLAICTVLYILIALVLTGMVNHTLLQVGDPLAFVFGPEGANIPWLRGVVAISAVVAMTTVLLVFQLGQPRIFFSMSRDGLLPKMFSKVHPKYRTPYVGTILTGLFVAIFAAFANIAEVVDLTNIGTLFAFVLVSIGVIFLRYQEPERVRPFRVPGVPFTPLISVVACGYLMFQLPAITWKRFGLWLLAGLVIYFAYGMFNSRLRRESAGK